jgi:hypothetical protein
MSAEHHKQHASCFSSYGVGVEVRSARCLTKLLKLACSRGARIMIKWFVRSIIRKHRYMKPSHEWDSVVMLSRSL